MLEIVTLGLTAAINLLLGLVIFQKNPRGATNRFFFFLTGTIVLWSLVNYISVHPFLLSQLYWIRLVLFCGALMNLAVFLTFLVFPSPNLTHKQAKKVKWVVLSTVFVMILTLTPLVFKTLKTSGGSVQPVPNVGIAIFLAQTLALLGASMYTIIKKYRSSTGRVKNQLRLVLMGLAGTFTLIILANFILVAFFQITILIPFGPAFTLLFSGAFTYAIIKHGLFDIRRAAARGLGYVLTIGFMATFYSLSVFGISSLILGPNQTDKRAQATYTALALILAFSFQPIKRFFDHLSNRVFFKDAYNPQTFLDSLNNVLVSQVELKPLLQNTSSIILTNLKSDYAAFVIRKTKYSPVRVIASHNVSFPQGVVDDVQSTVAKMHSKVIVADYLDGKHAKFGEKMNENNISVVVHLAPTLERSSEALGEILLGPKRNGEPYTNNDIQLLGIIANELVIAVENALRFEEIQNFNVTLQAKVDEATHKLRKANEKLKEMDETKDDFISMASHQLRTPLTSVKGYLSMVLEGDAGKVTTKEREMLGQAFFSSQRMVYLIADLLNVSRLKTGKFVIDRAPVNLAIMVSQELKQLQETAASRHLKLTYEQPKSFPDLMLDETKTRQVIMNFVDNAIYYTPAGGHIVVRVIDTPNTVEVRVEDDGIGVSKSDQVHLFTKFYRANNARKARPDGTGLGLFMAKKVIIAEGGSLIFESEEGSGSTFGFIFSKTQLATDAELPLAVEVSADESVALKV